jgi:arylsulfatase
MGSPTSFVAYGPGWAQAGAAPFKLFKSYSTEGGVVTPMIISGKFVNKKPGFDSSFINVMDLAPGFLELANITYPKYYHEKKMVPMLGVSFVPYLSGKSSNLHEKEYVYGLEHDGNCLLIKGKWKITNISHPFDENAFSQYDLSNDMAETKDLSKLYPDKYAELLAEWSVFEKKVGVIPKTKGE